MELSPEDRVWNRAAVQSGGPAAGPGDRALASLLQMHGLVMNGGLHHALQLLSAKELADAVRGYAYFGLDDVATWLRGAAAFRDEPNDPLLAEWTDETEELSDLRYAQMVPNDEYLGDCFARIFRERPVDFAPCW